MPKKIVSNTLCFQCCTKSVHTDTRFVPLQPHMPRWEQVCLFGPSVALWAIHALIMQAQVSLGRHTARQGHKGTCGWYSTFTGGGTTLLVGIQWLVLHRRSQAGRQGGLDTSHTPKSLPGQKPCTRIPSRGDGRAALGTSHRQDMPTSP